MKMVARSSFRNRFLAALTIMLIAGVIAGYGLNMSATQNQAVELQGQIRVLEASLTAKDSELTKTREELASWKGTNLRVAVLWHSISSYVEVEPRIVVANIGSVRVVVDSIAIKVGGTWYHDKTCSGPISPGGDRDFYWSSANASAPKLSSNSYYYVRVYLSSGSYFEVVSES